MGGYILARKFEFDKLRVDFPELGGYFPVPGTVKKLPVPWFSVKWTRVKDRRLGFELVDRNIAPLHFKTKKVAETALRAA